MFKTRLHTFGNVFGHLWNFDFFWFFWKFSKARPSMEHGAFFFWKNCHKTYSKQVWTILGTILVIFGTLNFFWFFPWIISKSLPQKITPENWTQIFYVRKTQLLFLCSGIWTQYFKSRKSEMELRILTVALMQKIDGWVLCPKTEFIFLNPEIWTHIFDLGNLNS